jgi:hypothetical protein
MDVPITDCNPQHWTLPMVGLLPFLLIGYILQLYLGVVFIALYFGKNLVKVNVNAMLNAIPTVSSGGWNFSAINIILRKIGIYLLSCLVPGTVGNDISTPVNSFLPTPLRQWNLLVIGLLLSVMSLGNLLATISTFVSSAGGKKVTDSKEWTYSFLYGTHAQGTNPSSSLEEENKLGQAHDVATSPSFPSVYTSSNLMSVASPDSSPPRNRTDDIQNNSLKKK